VISSGKLLQKHYYGKANNRLHKGPQKAGDLDNSCFFIKRASSIVHIPFVACEAARSVPDSQMILQKSLNLHYLQLKRTFFQIQIGIGEYQGRALIY
jgi:hypothetical protein